MKRSVCINPLMKKRTADDRTKINGFYINDMLKGFLGSKNEGARMLSMMGMPEGGIPFSAAVFLRCRETHWKDADGNKASISFRVRENQIECFGSYLGKKKSIRVFREWSSYEDRDMVRRLESEAIGDLCAKCIYENMNMM